MRHTFVCEGGYRLEVQQSKTTPGSVLLVILHSSGDRFGCITIPASTAALVAQAVEIEAVEAGGLTAGVSGVAGNGGEALKLSGRFAGLCDPGGGAALVGLPVRDLMTAGA